MATFNNEDLIKWNDLSTSLQDIIMRKITWDMLHPDLQAWLLDKEKRIIELERWRRVKVDPMLDDHERRINIIESKIQDIEDFIEDTKNGDSSVVNGYGDMFNGLPHYWTVCTLGNLNAKVRTDYWFSKDIYSPFNDGTIQTSSGTDKEFSTSISFPTTYSTLISFNATRITLINYYWVDTFCYFFNFTPSSVSVCFDSTHEHDADIGVRFGCMAIGIIP